MSAHAKRRKYSSPEDQAAILLEYAAGSTQVELAAKFDLTQVAVSKILRRLGAPTRGGAEANPPAFDVDEAERLYLGGLAVPQLSKMFGVDPSTVLKHLRARGVTRPVGGVQIYKGFNRAFFEVVDPLRAYWAGFIAADGNLHKNTVSFGLHVQDRDMLEKLQAAAQLPHPITEHPNNHKDNLYAWLAVTCKEWVQDLGEHYLLTPQKSMTLQPPTLPMEETWAYVRGYFDGDGHASKDGDTLHLVCGSQIFVTWIVREVFHAHHAIYAHGSAWGCRVSGPIFRATLPKLYAGSTPATRMARKYERFLAGGFVGA